MIIFAAVLAGAIVTALSGRVEGASGAAVKEVGLRPENIVIVVNDAVPDSLKLGLYYAQRRAIPADNICHLIASDQELISREDYTRTIEKPVREFLSRRLGQMRVALPEGELVLRLAKKEVRCLATIYGVPLKIEGVFDNKSTHNTTQASVDSDLALLPLGGHSTNGGQPNPYFRQDMPFNAFLARRLLLVCRLDGPSPEVVRGMIDDALWAEEHGLQGRAYFNTRGLTEGPYMEGDQWIRAACKDFQERRIASVLDDRLFPVDYPMTEPMFYLGWYNENVCGPMSRSDFRFARGAVAYHLHSFAAWTVRSTNQKWAGPLLAHGAAATMGSVWEPYLDGQPYLDVFANRLVRGYTFAESAYMSQRVLAWMSVFLGDPLYRPFLKPVRTPVTPEPPPRPAK